MKKNIKRMINLMDCAEKTKIELVKESGGQIFQFEGAMEGKESIES